MAKIWTLLLILAVSTLFIHVPHKGEIGFLLNPNVTLSYNQYFWMLVEKLIPIALAAIILDESRDYKRLLKVFLWIQIVDLAGFVLAYDDPMKDKIITFNVLKLIIFLVAIIIEKWNHWKQELKGWR